MTERAEKSRLGWLTAHVPFLAGVACAFLGCCIAGRLLGGRSCYEGFVRFHPWIAPDTKFYPTPRQVQTLALADLDPDQVLVIVGGNSILHGVGQGPQEVWTKHLQAALGDRFRVVNFAMRGAMPEEFGAIAAEMLERDHPKLLFVTDCGSSTRPGQPDGQVYRYFYWDAYYQGLVPTDPRRDARLAALAAERAKAGAAFSELQWGARLDADLRFQDVWTTLAYARLSTVWTPLTAENVFQPRKDYTEKEEPQPSLEKRYPPSGPAGEEASMAILHSFIRAAPPMVQPPLDECALVQDARSGFPDPCRRRTLMLVVRDSPHYVALLDPAEEATYAGIFPNFVRALEGDGMSALDIGANYSEMDYIDRCHLSEQGGRRLAADVAPKLRVMAETLGYLKGGSP